MREEPTTVEKLRGLPWSIAGYAANTFFAQFTFFGSVFVLFLSQLGLSRSQMGFTLSLIPFTGLVALFIAPAVARFGYKRTFLTFYGVRSVITAFLLFTPWIAARFGAQTTLIYVSIIVALFALCRAIAETGVYPWIQEYVPNSVRGKYSARNNRFTTLAGLAAVAVAGAVIGHFAGLSGYMILIGAGVLAGLLALWLFTHIPGGAPAATEEVSHTSGWSVLQATQDRNFMRYLTGLAVLTVGAVPMIAFLPLFMQDQVGLDAGSVIWLQTGTLLGGLLSGQLWGWAADRYGSKPVMQSGLSVRLLLPICWFMIPRGSEWTLYIALGIAILHGMSEMGWAIGSGRLLFVGVVPTEKKSDYMAFYYAWVGVVGGVSQLTGGWILEAAAGISGRFWLFVFDPHTPLFAMGLTLSAAGLFWMRQVRADSDISTGEFAGMFLRGNPVAAMGSLIWYHMARDERSTVLRTERLAATRSLLTVDELLESLGDPRFNVRYEAVIAISRMPPNPRLTEALVEILEGSELALSVNAAWALGRIGDPAAIEPLRRALNVPYRSIQAHSARALGALNDRESIPILCQRLQQDEDKGLQMAFASALGQLRAAEATSSLLELLLETQNEGARRELALSLARIVGDEHYFVQLFKQMQAEAGTAVSQAVTALQRKIDPSWPDSDNLRTIMEACAGALARQELDAGAAQLVEVIKVWSEALAEETAVAISRECARQLAAYGPARLEYILLALHTLNAAT